MIPRPLNRVETCDHVGRASVTAAAFDRAESNIVPEFEEPARADHPHVLLIGQFEDEVEQDVEQSDRKSTIDARASS